MSVLERLLLIPEIVAYTVIINRNVCIDILAKENKHSINVQIDDKIKEISEDCDHFEQLIVADMVEKLPDIYRDVIMMKYFYGFKVKEISKQLHLSVGGVKSRLEKARKILRKDINDDE
ncbi:RNA polymerase sigma factor [Ruminococcus sp.]|uniref:RNA polymerase sigma factor n=1 Tax=Ruminococcus sp. TaxID=41978 RepID=UPI003AB7AD15